MRSITYVIPPSGFLMDERVFPSLGVLKVAAVTRQLGHRTGVLDLSGVADIDGTVRRYVGEHGLSDAYGVSSTMPQMPAALAAVDTLRTLAPSARFILGGPHVTLMNASARKEVGGQGRSADAMRELAARFDVLVAGDGEEAIKVALADDPPALIDADDIKSPYYVTGAGLEQWPARDLLDILSYRYEIDGLRTMSLIAQLGCPFECAFCGGRSSPFLRRVRMRRTANVIDEMRHLYQTYGARGFMFLDDELNVNRGFMDLLDGIIALQREVGSTFRLRGLLKSELLTLPMAFKMYEAGFRQVLVGFESGSARVLENIKKKATVEDNTRCVQYLKQAGIAVKALMSIGHAGESAQTIRDTQRWLLDVRPSDFDVTVITPYPGTPYYDDAVAQPGGWWTYTAKSGDTLHMYPVDQLRDVNFYKGQRGAYKSYVFTDALTPDQICVWRDEVETTVRQSLAIPWPKTAAERDYEHSMGMTS